METQEPLHLLESAWQRLQAEHRRVHEEIRNYPRPIAACDLQFNYLLEERARIVGELQRMQEERQKLPAAKPPGAELGQPGQRQTNHR